MSDISVYARETDDGKWVLETADESRDLLAGPFDSEDLMLAEAEVLGLSIITTQVATTALVVLNRKPGDLFRIGGYWYRLIRHIRGNKNAMVEVVGENRTENIPVDTRISEISVLTLK